MKAFLLYLASVILAVLVTAFIGAHVAFFSGLWAVGLLLVLVYVIGLVLGALFK